MEENPMTEGKSSFLQDKPTTRFVTNKAKSDAYSLNNLTVTKLYINILFESFNTWSIIKWCQIEVKESS